MESNNLKWLCFSGFPDYYRICSTKWQNFGQNKGIFENFSGDHPPRNPLGWLDDQPTDEERVAHDAVEAAHRRAINDIERPKNSLWCHLAKLFYSTSLMLIRHDCVDNKGLCDGHRAWGLLQERFRSNETVTLVSPMRQLARIQLKQDEVLHNYFIRSQELSTRVEQAGEQLSVPLLNAMVPNSPPEHYIHFVLQESFNPTGIFDELTTGLTNYEESRWLSKRVDENISPVLMTSKQVKPKQKSSSK